MPPTPEPAVSARYTVGIDLGTSHTVVAYAAHAVAAEGGGVAEAGDGAIHLLPIAQLVAPGEVAAPALLPSVRYHPAPGELAAADLQLPWPVALEGGADTPPAVIGRYARDLGSQAPGRLVASAKSWLSHPGVDRTAAILPWGAADEVPKISPLQASASYLAHVRAAWNARFAHDPLEQQNIVLTVPASFDEGARALTLEAARLAGLPRLRLIEEPQAAFHDWLYRERHHWADALAQARLVLVCDVGGGTTDLTLIRVERDASDPTAPPVLTRIGVGDHLMLGGDNMDLALAHRAERELTEAGERLPAARFSQLVQRCRAAKELLLASDGPERTSVTLLGAGARLVGGARSATLTRAEVQQLVVDGFVPQQAASERPRRRSSGLVEFGLPYPADPAITRHLAAFLARHAAAARAALGPPAAEGTDPSALPVPDTLLLNGGVFRAPALADRLESVLARWRGAPVRVLHNADPDVAVARGAVAYALVRAARVPELARGVGGGAARSYFLVLDGRHGQGRALCVLPRGTDTGTEVPLAQHHFALRLGQAVRFHLVASADDRPWQAGDLVDLDAAAPTGTGTEADADAPAFVRLPPIETVLPAPEGRRRADVTVQLSATMTEVGTLEMHCASVSDPAQRWLLAFQLRSGAGEPGTSDTLGDTGAGTALPDAAPHQRVAEAVALIERIFGTPADKPDAREVRQLRSALERLLGARETWSLPLLRTLFDALWARARRRRRSAEHERVWLNLAGYCLRPGLGAPLDAWRIEQVWELFDQGIQYTAESRNWSEWWTLWRRAAGGLGEAQQLHILETLAGHLEDCDAGKRAKDPVQGSYDDMVRLAALLEQVPVAHRSDTGRWVLERLQRPGENPQTWWALGRIGARVPLYGSAHTVVPADLASEWLAALLALDWKAVEPAAFAATQIARMSGDRARDLPAALREAVAQRLVAARAPHSWATLVREAVQLDEADQRRSFGEALPPGLTWLGGGAAPPAA
nr:Hsp70 family protein [Acidovorax sp. SRB_14]